MDVGMVMKHLLGTENILSATDTWDRMISVLYIPLDEEEEKKDKRGLSLYL